MGKRKSTKPPPKKAAPKLDTLFNCPFCNSSKSVHCTIDHEKEMAQMRCTQCPMKYEMRTTHLTEPIDVYHEWLDKCEAANS